MGMSAVITRVNQFMRLALIIFLPSISFSAINPADPGLADASAYGQKAIKNNGSSSLCVECHSENPSQQMASHFVMNYDGVSLRITNSGGGWDGSYYGVRDAGQFFKITPWTVSEGGNGGTSKYGDSKTFDSYKYEESRIGDTNDDTSFSSMSPSMFSEKEIICESCHSLRTNVEGRYNLLAYVTNSPYIGDNINGSIADLCVGCHGFLYHDDGGVTNYLNINWVDPRNLSRITQLRRGGNGRHYIAGVLTPRNHHVMSGDAIDIPLANAGLLMRDVSTMSPELISNPIRTDSPKGSMPVSPVAALPIVLPENPLNLHCVTCHSAGHSGEPSLGAGILRGENLGGMDSGRGLDRISDGRLYGNYDDRKFCRLCHQ